MGFFLFTWCVAIAQLVLVFSGGNVSIAVELEYLWEDVSSSPSCMALFWYSFHYSGCAESQLWHVGSPWLHAGSVVGVHRLSCPVPCGILVPQPATQPASPALESRFLTAGPPAKSPVLPSWTEIQSDLFWSFTSTPSVFWPPSFLMRSQYSFKLLFFYI